MAYERKQSGTLVLLSWLLLTVFGLFLVTFGAGWYNNGHLRLCTIHEIATYASGAYKLPANHDDLLTPPYWCARRYLPAGEQLRPEPSSRPQADTATEAERKLEQGTELGNYNDTYAGIDRFWGDDIVGVFFDRLGMTAGRWIGDIFPVVTDQVISTWNAYFAGEDLENASHRTGLLVIISALLGAILATTVGMSAAWLNEAMLRKPNRTDVT